MHIVFVCALLLLCIGIHQTVVGDVTTAVVTTQTATNSACLNTLNPNSPANPPLQRICVFNTFSVLPTLLAVSKHMGYLFDSGENVLYNFNTTTFVITTRTQLNLASNDPNIQSIIAIFITPANQVVGIASFGITSGLVLIDTTNGSVIPYGSASIPLYPAASFAQDSGYDTVLVVQGYPQLAQTASISFINLTTGVASKVGYINFQYKAQIAIGYDPTRHVFLLFNQGGPSYQSYIQQLYLNYTVTSWAGLPAYFKTVTGVTGGVLPPSFAPPNGKILLQAAPTSPTPPQKVQTTYLDLLTPAISPVTSTTDAYYAYGAY